MPVPRNHRLRIQRSRGSSRRLPSDRARLGERRTPSTGQGTHRIAKITSRRWWRRFAFASGFRDGSQQHLAERDAHEKFSADVGDAGRRRRVDEAANESDEVATY